MIKVDRSNCFTHDKFQCSNYEFICSEHVCDDNIDCSDYSDERGCGIFF